MLLAETPAWVYTFMPHFITVLFVFAFGACVGSFMNVVIYRVPAGVSIISPPSRCPTCGARLTWRENLPIFGWLRLRGKCKWCKAPISAQYMVVELLTAGLFAAVYLAFFVPHWSTPWWGEISGPWWQRMGPGLAAPAFTAVLFMLAGLVAMTAIDARTFTIPLEIPLVVTICGVIGWTVQGAIRPPPIVGNWWPIMTVNWRWFAVAVGGMAGLGVGYAMLKSGRLRYSFSDYNEYLPAGAAEEPLNTDDVSAFEVFFALPLVAALLALGFAGVWWALVVGAVGFVVAILVRRARQGSVVAEPDSTTVLALDYPHARREMWIELGYLAPCIIGLVIGWFVGGFLPEGRPPQMIEAIGGALAGYLVGGGLVWAVRILGTLGFGREAMGIGDVHMLGAIGAVLGWEDVCWIFIIACGVALGWTALSTYGVRAMKGFKRELPFGPHLALATLVLIFCRPVVNDVRAFFFPEAPPPPSQAIQSPRHGSPPKRRTVSMLQPDRLDNRSTVE
jgi:leader peptidase (prepilin peptidase) / N-methyltransferase